MTDHAQCLEKLAIILPSLDPDDKFDGVVEGLVKAGFAHVVIVDDGSDAAHQVHFDKASAFPCCRVLHHGVNKGKGRALKTAFRCVLDELPDAAGVIDAGAYGIGSYELLKGFLSGLHAGNYDITHIFIDNFFKLAGDKSPEKLDEFIAWLEAACASP